jgi:hypothetical protein
MNVDLNQQEIWKILDAITAYKKDYAVSAVVSKTLTNVEKKLKDALQSEK